MSTTPIELVTVGKVPAREGGLRTSTAPSVVQVFPGVFLIASIVRAKNQCVLELVLPTTTTNTTTSTNAADFPRGSSTSPAGGSSPAAGASLSSSFSVEGQRRVSEGGDGGGPRRSPVAPPTPVVPVLLRSAFRVPRIIQLVAEDEGVIETVSLVREPLCTAFVAALDEQDRSSSQNPLRGTGTGSSTSGTTTPTAMTSSSAFTAGGGGPFTPSVHHVHVHFFIGTSNGTVIVGNALRGTILAVAQFQYHHLFTSDSRGIRSSTTATSEADEEEGGRDGSASSFGRVPARNQAVVKFVVRERREEQLWNPSLPYSQENTVLASQEASAHSRRGAPPSPTAGSPLASVFVVHSGGKVVELTRAALDIFVRSSVDRLDGRRPHLILEWEPETAQSPFPVAGPASDFAAHIGGIFVLTPPSSYSTIEKRSATAKGATRESTQFLMRDADVMVEMPEPAPASSQASALLAPLDAHRRPCEALVVCGSSPLFACYRLQSPTSRFSAAQAVKAVKSMVTGVARAVWFGALGTTNPVERPPHLKKATMPGERALLEADAKCSAVQVDPSQQWAAFAIEGGGRIYIADTHSGVVCGVLKGCRAAQFTWWWTECAAGRPALLLLVVYLPLRRAVEVYTPRTWDRLAACYVPEGCVLLRPCGVPCERRTTTATTTATSMVAVLTAMNGRSPLGSRVGPSACGGCGSAALLMDPAGTVYEVRVGWAVTDPAESAACLRMLSPSSPLAAEGEEESELMSASVLRSCRSPDEFMDVALQLPVPQPHVVWEDAALPCPLLDGDEEEHSSRGGVSDSNGPATVTYSVQGGQEVRRYRKALDTLCTTLQRRFAPGYAELVETAMPGTPQEALDGAAASVPRHVTAAQCLHYVRAYSALTENYYRLLRCRRGSPSRYFDPEQWTSGIITPQLWTANFSTADSAATATFVKHMEECVVALLATQPAELTIYKKYFAPSLSQMLRKLAPAAVSGAAEGSVALAEPGCFLPLSTFFRCFYCGGRRPTFLSGAIAAVEDADGSINFLGPLSDLAFGIIGLDAFFAQLPVLADLGCGDCDVAVLTMTWISRQAGRSLAALLSTTTVGPLAATLLSFSSAHFLHALDRAAIPFISVDGDVATATAAGSIAGLLWCCAVRLALRPSGTLASTQRLTRRVRQLLQLWHTLTKGVSVSQEVVVPLHSGSSGGCDARVAFSLRLSSVEPPSLPFDTAEDSGVLVWEEREDLYGSEVDAEVPEGDTFEVYLQRNGITLSLMDAFVVPRPDADADAVRHLPLFSSFVSLLGLTEHIRSGSSSGSGTAASADVRVTTLPWIEGQQWEEERFRNEVCKPLERLWQQLATAPPAVRGTSGSSAFRNAFRGTAVTDNRNQSVVYKSCLLLVAMRVLDHALRPLTDLTFFFWENSLVPDGNFFPLDGNPAGLILAGSRTSRDYLKSLQRLAALVERIIEEMVAPLDDAKRVVLIQQISTALTEDDAVLFPLIPNFLRVRLTIWMQVLAQAPHTPLRRVQRVGRLVALLLFFSEASAMTMGGVALTQLQSHLSVPWTALIGGPNRREQLRLLPDSYITGVAASPSRGFLGITRPVLSPYALEDEIPHQTPLQSATAAALMRSFLLAGAVLYRQQHQQQRGGQVLPIIPTPPLTPVLPAAPLVGLISADTRQCLARLSLCLGLHVVLPDMADVVLMDYAVKHLFPVAMVEQEMLLLATKTAAPHVAMSTLQSYLVAVLQYATAQRKGHGQRGERAAFEIASEQLSLMVGLLSGESRAWLQERETQMQQAAAMAAAAAKRSSAGGSPQSSTTTSGATSVSDNSGPPAVPLDRLLCDVSWVTLSEFRDMRRLAFVTLALPKMTPERKNFFQVLSTLSQWACEGRLSLPAPLQRIARELPVVVRGWAKTV